MLYRLKKGQGHMVGANWYILLNQLHYNYDALFVAQALSFGKHQLANSMLCRRRTCLVVVKKISDHLN